MKAAERGKTEKRPGAEAFSCRLCPRACSCDRVTQLGFCGMPQAYVIARAAPHYDEEPIISGSRGAGNIFFAGCTMACAFCQNYPLSHERKGWLVEEDQLVDIMLRLQEEGVHNIGLVTADHYLHRLPATLRKARKAGLTLPVSLNSSSYISVQALQGLEGLVDIYLADLKYYDDRYALRYSKSPHYFAVASRAIQEMFLQTGPARLNEDGLLTGGLLIRHLALPGLGEDSAKLIRWVGESFPDQVYFSLMSQYFPCYDADQYPEINRRLTEAEYDALWDIADRAGIRLGFSQELGQEDESRYVPAFDKTGLPASCPPFVPVR